MYQDLEPGITWNFYISGQWMNFEFRWKQPATKVSSANNFRHASQILIFKQKSLRLSASLREIPKCVQA